MSVTRLIQDVGRSTYILFKTYYTKNVVHKLDNKKLQSEQMTRALNSIT